MRHANFRRDRRTRRQIGSDARRRGKFTAFLARARFRSRKSGRVVLNGALTVVTPQQQQSEALRSGFAAANELGYYSHVATRAVSIAELKNKLSAYLAEVRRGEELVVNDRKL